MLQCHQSQVAFPNKNARTNEKLTYISLVNSARRGMFGFFFGGGSTLPRCLATSYDIIARENQTLTTRKFSNLYSDFFKHVPKGHEKYGKMIKR